MASEVTRVVSRCEMATETENLDLSECDLKQFPVAVFHLVRNTNVKTCNLSANAMTKIPAKLCFTFSYITELNLSNNKISKLPDELRHLQLLQCLDLSFNSFVSLPEIAFVVPMVEKINAQKNFITELNVDHLKNSTSLKEINLTQNPLSLRCLYELTQLTIPMQVLTTPYEKNDGDWAESS